MHAKIGLLLLLSLTASWAASEENFSRQLPVAPGGQLLVEIEFGNIEIAVGDDQGVSVQARRRVDAKDEATEQRFLASMPIVITQEGPAIHVRALRSGNEERQSWSGHMASEATYTIRVPKSFAVDLRTRGGNIVANGLHGKVVADTKGGEMRFAHLGGSLDARTSGGDISLDTCTGPLQVVTSGGAITSQNGGGSLKARTAGGSISVRDFAGDATVNSSGGKLTLENVRGALDGRTAAGSISAALSDPVDGHVKLRTSAGSIEVALSEKAAVDVDAKAGMGRIRTEIPLLATRADDDRLRGTLNGGGQSLLLNTSVGSITLRPMPKPTAAR